MLPYDRRFAYLRGFLGRIVVLSAFQRSCDPSCQAQQSGMGVFPLQLQPFEAPFKCLNTLNRPLLQVGFGFLSEEPLE